MRDFQGGKVFVTGGSSGIGKEIARSFLKLGAHVTIAANMPDKLAATYAELSQLSSSVESVVCDIADLQQVRTVAANYLARYGAPDILVNNAGYAVYRKFEEMDSEEIQRLVNVNLTGACLLTREFLPAMIHARRGHIILMASIAGRVPITPCGMYGAAKHGMVSWGETLMAELAEYRIGVHVICPARVQTDFFDHQTFVTRAPRPEASKAMPASVVAQATIDAIQSGRFITHIPRWHGAMVWLSQTLPFIARPSFQRLMRARVASMRPNAETRKRTAV
jgi:short-subunit dehydrogenase